MGHTKRVAKAYFSELGGSMAIYIVLLVGAMKFGRPLADGPLRTAILVLPTVGFLLAIWAIARHVRRIDEYARQTLLETFAIGAAITAAVTFSYGFLETAGFPRISMFTVWPIMGSSWGLVCLVRYLLTR
jgi:hypothetical protein